MRDKKKLPYESIIRALSSKKEGFKSEDFVQKSSLSRQSAARILSEWVKAAKLYKEGSTKTSRYFSNSKGKLKKLVLVKKLSKLEEDQVFNEIELRLGLKKELNESSYVIFRYAFTEMLNNAIDHSKSTTVNIEVSLQGNNAFFSIRDFGLGIFQNIQKEFRLDDEYQALSHLLKGKQTTQPEKHSGQGIFFTSKIADYFSLKSHKIEFSLDNFKNDYTVAECRFFKGTEVKFKIGVLSRKKLKSLFDEFSDKNYEFDKTIVRIRLGAIATEFISRSEAKRLLLGMEKFSRIELDFKGVKQVGQGFADEVFRVFQRNNTDITLVATHANSAVAFMIERTRRDI